MTTILLLACAAPNGDCGEVISVTISSTYDEDGEVVVLGDPCTEADPVTGALDVTACCPEGYTFLAVGSTDTVLCEEDCP